MSVVNMKRLTVLVHKSRTDEIVKKLMRLRCVEISECDSDADFKKLDLDAVKNELEIAVDDIARAIVALGKASKRFRGVSKTKINADLDSFEDEGFADRAVFTVYEALASAKRKEEIKDELTRIDTQLEAIKPYSEFDLPLGTVGTRSTSFAIGSLPQDVDIDDFGRTLYEKGAIIKLISESQKEKFLSVLWHNSDGEEIERVLTSFGFEKANFEGVDKTPSEYKAQLESDREGLIQERYAIDEKFFALGENLSAVKIYYDIKQTALNEAMAKQKLVATDSTVMILGWIPAAKENIVSELLEKYDCAYSVEVPGKEDKPPILLNHRGFAEDLEWIPRMCSGLLRSRAIFTPDCPSNKYTKEKENI